VRCRALHGGPTRISMMVNNRGAAHFFDVPIPALFQVILEVFYLFNRIALDLSRKPERHVCPGLFIERLDSAQ
jgi:hypothetical protein